MSEEIDEDNVIRSARISRYRDGTIIGCGIHLTGDDLRRLDIDPVETDVVDVVIRDGNLQLVPGDGEPVIVERGAPSE